LIKRLFPMPVEGEPVFAACGISQFEHEIAESFEVQRDRLHACVETILRHGGGSRFVNKRIANNRRIPLLVRIFPAARFVELVRDGRAVAYSLSRVNWWEDDLVWWYGGTPRQWREEGRDPWEICARNWVEEVREIGAGLARVPPAQVLGLRYEALVRDPLAVLEQAAEFVGLRPNPGWLARVRSLHFPDSNEAWRSQLDPITIDRITSIQRDCLLRHGYAS
jgi:hypothetical protein